MPALPVDREKLREQVSHLPPENLLMLLDRAIDDIVFLPMKPARSKCMSTGARAARLC